MEIIYGLASDVSDELIDSQLVVSEESLGTTNLFILAPSSLCSEFLVLIGLDGVKNLLQSY